MTISIERAGAEQYIVRCIDPQHPPFKALEIVNGWDAAVDCARAMLHFPERKIALT